MEVKLLPSSGDRISPLSRTWSWSGLRLTLAYVVIRMGKGGCGRRDLA